MTRYIHWLLPFVLPFMFLGLIRFLWWAADAAWNDPASAAITALVSGFFAGAIFAAHIEVME